MQKSGWGCRELTPNTPGPAASADCFLASTFGILDGSRSKQLCSKRRILGFSAEFRVAGTKP